MGGVVVVVEGQGQGPGEQTQGVGQWRNNGLHDEQMRESNKRNYTVNMSSL